LNKVLPKASAATFKFNAKDLLKT